MLPRIILSVTSAQITAGRWRLGKLVSCENFSNDETGYDKFRRYLGDHPNIPIYLIVDVVEEDFRLETMPHTFGRSRSDMVNRKLNQLYRNTSYRTAQWAGREPDKRRDDHFLFMALTNPDLLAPWIKAIEDSMAPLAGIYLKPSISQLLVKALGIEAADLLLITRQGAGVRHTYFSNRQLRISRLTSLVGMNSDLVEKLYVSATEKMRSSLIGLRLMSRESRLQIVCPMTEALGHDLASQLESGQNVHCTVIAPERLAHSIGLDPALLARFPDLPHMQILAKYSCPGNLAPAPQLQQFRLHKLRLGINLLSAAIVTTALAIAVSNVLSAAELSRQKQDAVAGTALQHRLYQKVASNFPKTPLPGSDLKTAVNLADTIRKISHDPHRLMQVVSTALDRQHEIVLVRLRWMLAEDADTRDDDSPATATTSTHLAAPPSPTGLYEVGFVDGEIGNFTGDYRTATDSVNRLVGTLKQHADVEQVAILQQPVDTSSFASLQGSTLDQQAQQLPAARFKLKILLKPGAAK